MNLNITLKKVRYSGACITLILTSFLTGTVNQTKAQTVGFVQQDIIKKSAVYTDIDMDGLAIGDRQTIRTYYNGMGQSLQTVAIKASPSAMDIIQPYAYDNLGRQTTSYLPYVGTDGTGSYRPNALSSEQAAYYGNGLSDKVADDITPSSTVQVEYSPLQRLLSSGSVGNGFQPGQHASVFNYRSNNSGDGNIIIWGPTGSNLGNYAIAALSVSEGTDADNAKTITFTDIAGHTVLKRQYTATAGVYLDTYYIYNNAGMISYIVPPKALGLMVANSNYSLTQAGVVNLVFQYVYDTRGRLIQKIVPGTGAVNIIYDPWNRPLLVQNAGMAASYKWYYIKYDVKGHAISQGIYVDPNHYTATAMQTSVNSNTVYYESRSTVSATGYYTNNMFPSTGITPLAYSYFDNYDMDMSGTDDYSYTTQGFTGNEGSQTTDPTKGVPTMVRKTTMTNNTASGTWLVSYTFYDRYGRAIQTKSNNLITTTVSDVKSSAMDFTGAPTQTKVIKVTGSTTTTVLTTIGYDPNRRPITIDQSYNGATAIRIAAYTYNELGQMIDKKLHSTNGGSTYMQSVDYRYNIRGQLLSINNSKLTSDTGTGSGYTNDDSNDLFGMQFLYDQVDANVGNKAYYNGKLSAVKWMSKDGSGNPGYERSYKYAYDAMGRYTTATYAERTTGTGAFNYNIGGFNENVTYDVGGNITTLGRNSSTSPGSSTHIQIDTLTYSYDASNPYWLYKVSDGTDANHTGAGFKNITNNSTFSYSHDANGNMTIDPNKGLVLAYNDLNRTDKITITTATNRYIMYTYDASGSLIRKQAYDNNILQTTTDYIDGFVYLTAGAGTPGLSYFAMPEGRVRNSGTALKLEYIINDQQGNARISFEESTTPGVPQVRQENSYYPSGLIMPNSLVGFPSGNTDNKHLYNGGSEWQNDFGSLPDYYQTFYRNYDAALMQFVAVDPEPESAESMSTYQYAGNNPVVYNDPLGNFPTPVSPYGNTGGSGIHSQSEFWTQWAALWGTDVVTPPEADYFGMRTGGSDGGNKAFYTTYFAALAGDPLAIEQYAMDKGATIYQKGVSNSNSNASLSRSQLSGYLRYVGQTGDIGSVDGGKFTYSYIQYYGVSAGPGPTQMQGYDIYTKTIDLDADQGGYVPAGGASPNWYDIGSRVNALWGATTPFVKSSIGYLRDGAVALKYYSSGWRGGSRAMIKTMKFAKIAGVAGFAAGEIMDIEALREGKLSWRHAGINLMMGIVGFTEAAPLSIAYFGIDAFYPGGVSGLTHKYGDVHFDFSHIGESNQDTDH